MTLDAPPTPTPFSVALREATWAKHEGVDPSSSSTTEPVDEGPGILGALLDGDLHLDDYAALTAQQYFIYQVLDEAAQRWRDHPLAGRFVFDELSRTAAFDADLSVLVGPQWRDSIRPIASTARYVARLRQVCLDWPGGFVAHHYTRFLGDLSGGQAFRSAINDAYGFADGPGVRFYVFDAIDDITDFKNRYRAELDAAGWSQDERRRIIDEVLTAYDYNGSILSELGTMMRRSV